MPVLGPEGDRASCFPSHGQGSPEHKQSVVAAALPPPEATDCFGLETGTRWRAKEGHSIRGTSPHPAGEWRPPPDLGSKDAILSVSVQWSRHDLHMLKG